MAELTRAQRRPPPPAPPFPPPAPRAPNPLAGGHPPGPPPWCAPPGPSRPRPCMHPLGRQGVALQRRGHTRLARQRETRSQHAVDWFGWDECVCVVRPCALFEAKRLVWGAAAEANQRDQGLPPDRAPEGRPVREDQEVRGRHQVQGPVQSVPVHAVRHRLRQSRQVETVATAR